MKVNDMKRLAREGNPILRCMCGVTLRDRIWFADSTRFNGPLGVAGMVEVVSHGRMRW